MLHLARNGIIIQRNLRSKQTTCTLSSSTLCFTQVSLPRVIIYKYAVLRGDGRDWTAGCCSARHSRGRSAASMVSIGYIIRFTHTYIRLIASLCRYDHFSRGIHVLYILYPRCVDASLRFHVYQQKYAVVESPNR